MKVAFFLKFVLSVSFVVFGSENSIINNPYGSLLNIILKQEPIAGNLLLGYVRNNNLNCPFFKTYILSFIIEKSTTRIIDFQSTQNVKSYAHLHMTFT